MFARAGWRSSFALPLVTFIAGALAVIILASLLGGLGEWITFYRMYARKSADIPYVIQFQGGAWYCYLVDFTLLSPVIVALVFGRIFNINKESRVDFFCALLLGFSFVAMSAVSGGMSLRFAAYWDFPLRWLAASQVLQLSEKFHRVKPLFILAGLTLILAAVDLFQVLALLRSCGHLRSSHLQPYLRFETIFQIIAGYRRLATSTATRLRSCYGDFKI